MSLDFKKRKINLLEDKLEESSSYQLPRSYHFLKQKPSGKNPAKPTGLSRRKKFSCFFILLIVILSIVGSIVSANNENFLAGVKNSYLIRQITHIVSSSEKYLKGEKEDRINFVLLGMGGPGHNGPYLTDTIIIVSFKPSTKEAGLISLPRDMIVPLHNNDYRKINSIYTIGQQSPDTTGGELLKEVVSKTLNMPIHYFAAVDFNGFVEIIDAIGGVEVTVDRSFTDNLFPTADYKYQEVSFQAGEQEMDGLTALRFARSRHGNNGEGSDFARIKRQQKIILAAKDKITSFNTLINPRKIISLFSLINKYTATDLEPWEAVKLIHLAKSLDTQNIAAYSIDDRPGGYLKAGIALDGAYILQPVTGNFEQIQLLTHNILDFNEVESENAKIVMQNGTDIPGLALQAVNHLTQMNYNVLRYGNAPSQEKLTTVIYNYNDDKPRTKESLEGIFQVKAEKNIPWEYSNTTITQNWNITDENGQLEQLDFLIILGADQKIDEGIEIVTTIDPELLNTTTPSSTDEIIEE
ncbi:MAG: hypothetical protein COV55_01420 [Candidatus Komeilibacteria bacterium CG11_big_fil_rev_8_21_14_0_20_36_20]|uniref:Cell envelope-related transcriptional attenuator domain-containing protein n=1 Tax=Candidatus Komeilibacteria bacterium CG11_big_fil_rev_8_21_14_0_20_36_20 TaxID=1974477 RepID=A0A2H0NDU4_9BACT|nr:MAG: hypothetical protein COV55_01420 [Candidatus Komeilibacteria bacterium CG11_big_fil_rev_8_21_14_0_20_36_20]PIR81202.1 MAG: hypothetical protein COU21_04405 [Candidatus Komeilibacteria bacterium CG10_big_fil_rev_8_21_14_0_10_36_65]PJC55166.1 MAG: hypothetical protein CO027_03345 [Candidatus Komeilibacteria bacterium CG_4_9_14_0_2_um_filter_36_13]